MRARSLSRFMSESLEKKRAEKAYKLVSDLRNRGIIVETDYMDRSVKAQMKYANAALDCDCYHRVG